MKITLLVSLPGGNKTTYARNNLPPGAVFIDDPKALTDIKGHNCEELWIADPHFCRDTVLKFAITFLKKEYDGPEIKIIYWKNDLEKCWKNVQGRADKRVISKSFIAHLSASYNPPPDALEVLS
jgi:hypothetical protein